MMNIKFKKIICGGLTAAVIFGCTPIFADTEKTDSTAVSADETSAEATASPEPTSEPSAEPTSIPEVTSEPEQTPEQLSLKVIATVYAPESKNYSVSFKSSAGLPEIVGFSFTAEFSDATIESASMGDEYDGNGDISKMITDDSSVTFSWKNGTTARSGSFVLGTAAVESSSSLSSSNISITSFTATKADGSTVEITPELVVTDGVNVPDLDDDEQDVYDLLIDLPTLDELTFYKNSDKTSVYDVSSYYLVPIDTALEKYEALSTAKQNNVDTALSAAGLSIASINSLQKTVSAMIEVRDIVEMQFAYDGITDSADALNYQFLKVAYDSLSIDAPQTLKRAETAYSEYTEAVLSIESYNEYISSAVSAVSEDTAENLNTRISALQLEYDRLTGLTEYALYSSFVSAVKSVAEELYDDIDTNYSGTYKEYMLQNVQTIIDEIEDGSVVTENLPTFEVTYGICIGSSWRVKVKRNSRISDQEATVKIASYNSDGTEIQYKIDDFEKDVKEIEVVIPSNKTLYPSTGTAYVKCYYIYNNISYYLGEESVSVYSVKTSSGGSSGGGFDTSGSSGSSSGSSTNGSVYTDVTATAKPTAAPGENLANENPYTDIDDYDWAMESIIGLTNAGIVNGMGDGEFQPAGKVTREQFCKMVVSMFGLETSTGETQFADVDETKWYAPYVAAAVNAGYVQGQSDDYFGIGEEIMRQDMATILYRAIDMTGDQAVLEFTDNSDIASYAYDAVAELVGLGVMNGYEDGSFKPRGTATRAEASKVVWGIYNIIK